MNKNFKLNFSDEDFCPSPNGFFIKRFSKYEDDAFIYALDEFLTEASFNGVCYVGEKRGEIPFENFDQDVWEKSVLFNIKYVAVIISGDDYDVNSKDLVDFEDYVISYDNTRHQKLFYIYYPEGEAGSDADYLNLKDLINDIVRSVNGRNLLK